MARGARGFEAVELVSPDGRVVTWATSQNEVNYLKNQGYRSLDDADNTGADAETANAGREGNEKAAQSSTTKVARDGVARPATSHS